MRSAEFLTGLLASTTPAFVAADDFEGPHAAALRRWQECGFIAREPGRHPVPSCPHCGDGVPYRAEDRLLCRVCHSAVDPKHLLAWPVEREAFLEAVAARLGLRAGTGRVADDLWDLGSGRADGKAVACFFHAGNQVSDAAAAVLGRYRHAIVLTGAPPVDRAGAGQWVPLDRALDPDGRWAAVTLTELLGARGAVRFDPDTGALRVGGTVTGEVPLGGREWALLAVLAEEFDQFVPYATLKREVLRRTGGRGGAEEATFCQKLKSRIKKEFIPGIDRLVVTSNKGDGYRLRARA
jgi:hypothetical protein